VVGSASGLLNSIPRERGNRYGRKHGTWFSTSRSFKEKPKISQGTSGLRFTRKPKVTQVERD
jgi:hypothetical protein